jgi:UDP-glucose 4-epimerase
VERFIYFSTAHVYGAPLVGSLTEQSLPRPVHPYSITHKVAEDFVLAARDQGKIQGIVLRLSNGFGAPAHAEIDRWTLVVNDLCRQAVADGVLVLRSPGLQWRDFITLTDVARAVAHFLNLPETDCGDGLFNIGGDCSLRIIDVARLVARRSQAVLGITLPIKRPEPGPGDEQPTLDYKIDKLQATGFTLLQNHEEEIDATLRFCRELAGGR